MTDQRASAFTPAAAANDGDFAAQDWALFLGISLIWGASFLLIAESLESLTPAVVTLGRVGSGAITLVVLRAITERKGGGVERADRLRVTALAVVWVAVPFTLFPLAQQWINSAIAGLLNGATPVLVAVVSVALVRVRPAGRQLVGLAIGLVGIVLVSAGSAGEGSSEARGVLLVLAATVCYGVAFNLAPPLQARYGAVVLMSEVLATATILVAPLALFDLGSNRWQTSSVVALVALGSIGTGVAYWIMASLVGRIGSIRASFI
ncbi:MAG: DMT family transporter, partial [Actinomycetota bacterium]